MLNDEQIKALVSDMWALHLQEASWLDRIYGYVKGIRGVPAIPDDAENEIKDLAKLSVLNVLGMVRDSFAQNLSVVGYRAATATENAPAWKMWQRNRMDARQGEIFRPMLTYGASYVVVLPGERGPVFRPRSPRQLLAVYEDPTVDAWPQYAMETWVTQKDAKLRRQGLLLDSQFMYQIDLGELTPQSDLNLKTLPYKIQEIGDPVPHGGAYEGEPVCPVVRFVNDRDADDWIVGEVAPLIQMQQAINNVNFDRLIVSRFGAQPQDVIVGWSGTAAEFAETSARHKWVFDDEGVRVQRLTAGTTDSYNALLADLLEHVAMTAGISPAQVTGKMINVSAEALAAAEATMQRKLRAKRDSSGESIEQMLRLGAAMDGDAGTAEDESAEVVWRDTEARSFAAVVDGVTKLATVNPAILPHLLTLIPGITQQQVAAIKEDIANSTVPAPSTHE